jgi:hypothetical protein
MKMKNVYRYRYVKVAILLFAPGGGGHKKLTCPFYSLGLGHNRPDSTGSGFVELNALVPTAGLMCPLSLKICTMTVPQLY